MNLLRIMFGLFAIFSESGGHFSPINHGDDIYAEVYEVDKPDTDKFGRAKRDKEPERERERERDHSERVRSRHRGELIEYIIHIIIYIHKFPSADFVV